MKMLQVVVPILNEYPHLPQLYSSLIQQKNAEIYLVLVDNGSDDGSWELIKKWKPQKAVKKIKILQEKKRGFAPPLNRGIKFNFSPYIAVLDANTFPESDWAFELLAGFQAGDDLLVGNTQSLLSASPTPAEKFANIIFANFSERAATAQAHALPWGPNCNLAFRRSLWNRNGSYLPESGPALDLDWCWRALLTGAALRYLPKAIAHHQRRPELNDFLKQMQRYGQAEHWLIERFATLLGADKPNSVFEQAMAGAERILAMPVPEELFEIRQKSAIAFATGIQAGALKKIPAWKKKITRDYLGWPISENQSCLWHRNHGIAELSGDENFVWQMHIRHQSISEISKALAQKNHWSVAEAKNYITDFLRELSHG